MTKGIWRHKNCFDMDLVIVKITYPGSRYIKAKVIYINRHNGDIFGRETIKIQRKHFKDWTYVGVWI